ncbi:hypothetical protein J6590_073051 [Homalodisca vitripennis]|nr:hypothetical protein J6590_073051 [Homalodisca vitripennis]
MPARCAVLRTACSFRKKLTRACKSRIPDHVMPLILNPQSVVRQNFMPLTNKEKMARRRERQKADPVKYAAALEKDRLRKKVNRQIFKESATEKEMKDFKCREVQRVMGYYSKKNLYHIKVVRTLPPVRKTGLFSAISLATIASERNPNIMVAFISKEDVHNSFAEVEEMWYSAVLVPDTHSVHYCATVADQRYIIVGETSTDLSMRKVRILKGQAFDSDSSDEDEMVEGEPVPTLQINDIKPFDWVVVKYEDVFYPGEVKQVKLEENEVEVQVMHVSKTGKYYYWPKDEDCICYLLKDVIKKIGSPIPCEGTREQYKFNDSINVY